ncbi:acyltransferase family protein [Arthrobacter ramosus]|uniref:acyltransferase family protein n=1 Tax=Arthrobacter ramosus TaxID=1672 RepID=UPI001F35F334|nr:acyltransferase [Arthrobacter ramosus]
MDIRGSLRDLVFVPPGRNGALDGLRGVAILLVLASHASAGRFPLGGMVGVTLFFVLSGYLITGILIRERDRFGSVDFRDFYLKRALRLLPALTALLLLTPIALWLLRDPRLSWDLLGSSLSTFFYISDFVRATGDPMVVLGHTWSLAVEEQFYLIWPAILVLAALRWLSKAKVFWAVVLLAVILAVWRLVASGMFTFDRSYFSLDTNAFGLIFGACLALRPIKLSHRSGTVLASGSSSELAAAKSKISQLEAQPTANAPQNMSGTPSAAPTAGTTPTAAAVTISGDGQMASKKVALKGDYSVSWKTLGSCYYSATLKSGADSLRDPEAFTADHEASGTNNVYGLKATDYYLDVITGPAPSCGWTVTMTPVP